MTATTVLQALDVCTQCLDDILDVSLKSGKEIFSKDTLADVRKIAEAAIYYRKKKNFGVIAGSLTGVAGGIASIVGAALIPFTFGASIALIISGGVVGLAGAGASIGFSIEKVIGDKSRVEQFKPHLEIFINFNKCFAESTVTIHELLVFLRGRMHPRLSSKTLTSKQKENVKNLEEHIKTLYIQVEEEDDMYETLKLIDTCVKNIHVDIGDVVKHFLTIEDLRKFPETAEEKDKKRKEDQNEDELFAFDHIMEAIPSPPMDEKGLTFRVFIRKYLDADYPTASNQVTQAGTAIGGAAGKVVIGGASAGGRAAIRALDASDNVAKIGGTVARIAKGVSAASIVLSALGIAVDLAFLGHAVYDLKKLHDNEKRRSSEKDVRKESTEFADLLRDLAEIMDRINDFCRDSSSNGHG